MPNKPDNPFKFWEELKRRKVVRVIIGYLASSYVLLELTSIIAGPWGLPEWTINFVSVLLIIGFFVTVIISWIYDVTPAGIKKTESAKGVKTSESFTKPAKWKLKFSDVIISILIVLVIILAYPRFFKKGTKSSNFISTATFINEFGAQEKHLVVNEDFIHKIMIIPFALEGTDSTSFWLKYGIYRAVWEDLTQFSYILPYRSEGELANIGIKVVPSHFQEQLDAAKLDNCPYFLTGSIQLADGLYNIRTRLYQTSNGSTISDRTYAGNDLFSIIDSISLHVRIDIGVPATLISSFPDLSHKEHTTNNLEAYKNFIFAEYWRLLPGIDGSWAFFNKAIELDPSFALASYYPAWYRLVFQSSKLSAMKYIDMAMDRRGRFPMNWDMNTRILYYRILGDKEKVMLLLENQSRIYPNNINTLIEQVNLYNELKYYPEAEAIIKKLIALVPDNTDYQIMLADNYLLTNKLGKGTRYIKGRLREYPGNPEFTLLMARFHLHRGELEEAERSITDAILLSPEKSDDLSLYLDNIRYLETNHPNPENLERFTGSFRAERTEHEIEYIIHNDHLAGKTQNSGVSYYYQLSDSTFFSDDGFFFLTYCTNDKGEVFRRINRQDNFPNMLFISWKQDSLILSANKLFEEGEFQKALRTYNDAFIKNPDHYYLEYYIKHLEFISEIDPERYRSLLQEYSGKYEDWDFFILNDQFRVMNEKNELMGYILFPISETQFFSPSIYTVILEFVKTGNKVTGYKSINKNGNIFFFQRSNE